MDSLLKSREALIITYSLLIADKLKLLNNLKLNFISHSRYINTMVFLPLRRKKERKDGRKRERKGRVKEQKEKEEGTGCLTLTISSSS